MRHGLGFTSSRDYDLGLQIIANAVEANPEQPEV